MGIDWGICQFILPFESIWIHLNERKVTKTIKNPDFDGFRPKNFPQPAMPGSLPSFLRVHRGVGGSQDRPVDLAVAAAGPGASPDGGGKAKAVGAGGGHGRWVAWMAGFVGREAGIAGYIMVYDGLCISYIHNNYIV